MYPHELVEDLVVLGRLVPGDRVLEIGCGTGQLTVPLARGGLEIVCVELGERMVAVARRNLAEFPEVAVETAAFETWDPAGRSFEMVVAATSWHWLDPEVRYVKVAQVLKVGGVYTADQYIDLLNTYSGHRAMKPETPQRFHEEIRLRGSRRPDGRVTKHNLNTLHVVRGRPTTP